MELEQDPIHRHKDVLAHTIAVVAKTSPRLKLRLAALLHDVGKPGTRGYGPQGVTFHYHDVVGARMARQRLLALRYPNDIVDDVSKLVELHLRFHTYSHGLDRQRGAPLRARRGPAARRSQRADALRLHDPQREEGGRARAGWTSSRRGSPSCGSRRSWRSSGPRSTATR